MHENMYVCMYPCGHGNAISVSLNGHYEKILPRPQIFLIPSVLMTQFRVLFQLMTSGSIQPSGAPEQVRGTKGYWSLGGRLEELLIPPNSPTKRTTSVFRMWRICFLIQLGRINSPPNLPYGQLSIKVPVIVDESCGGSCVILANCTTKQTCSVCACVS